MTVTTNDRGQNNMWAKEPRMYISKEDQERYGLETYAERAEKTNGRWDARLCCRPYLLCNNWKPFLWSSLMTPNAERINGWAAMLGIIAAMGAYAVTGQVIPGIW